MRDLRPLPYRVLLLASVAAVAFAGTAFAQTGPGPVKTLGAGQSLSNSSNITATSGQAVLVNGGAGSIANSGLIQATGANGVGVQVVSGGSVGSITNSGTIQTTNGGNAILVGDTVGAIGSIGTLTNTGLIQSTGASAAIQINSGGSIGAILNSGGTIQALGSGAAVNVVGALGTLNNTGMVLANSGAAIANSGSIGSIVNSGEIVSQTGAAISMAGGGVIGNGITNAATGLIQGGPANGSGVAIDNSNSPYFLSINNAGTIIGAIKLGASGDTLNVTGGSITGAIIGMAGSHDAITFNTAGTFTTGGAISNVDTISVNQSTVVLQNPISGASSVNIAYGAMLAMNANIQSTTVNNFGALNVGAGSSTITGNYNQLNGTLGSGTLGVTIAGPGPGDAGKLTVTGTATIQNGANAVSVHVPSTTNDFALVANSWHVLTAGTLSAPGSLSASSDNAGISFGLTSSSTDLIVTGLAMSAAQVNAAAANDVTTIFAPFPGTPNFDEIQARLFLTQVFAGLAAEGHVALLDTLFNMLDHLTPSQVLQLDNQLMPSSIGSSQESLATTLNALNAGDSTIFGHLTTARLQTEHTGLAAGDQVGRGYSFWGQPFGAISSQGAHDGLDGYDAGTYGITFGADTLAAPGLRVGVALTLSNSNLSYNGSLSGNTGSVFTGELALYGSYQLPNNVFFDALLGAALNHYNRHNLISALGIALDSDSGGSQLTAKIGAGYDYHLPNSEAVLTPYVSLQQYHFNFGSYTTTGGSAFALDQHVSGNSSDLTQSRLGVRYAQPVHLQGGGVLTPEIHAYWLHDFGTSQLTTTYTTADVIGPSSFTFIGPAMDRDMANIGLSATFARGPAWSFSGGYDFLGSSSVSTHNFYVQLKLNF